MDLLETALAAGQGEAARTALIAGAAEPSATRLLALDMLAVDLAAGEAFDPAALRRSNPPRA